MTTATPFPSFEDAVEHYSGMRQEIIEELDRKMGPREWSIWPGSQVTNAYDEEGRIILGLADLYFEGGYPQEERTAAAEAIATVASRHGFTQVVNAGEDGQNFVFSIADDTGGVISLISAVNTVLMLRTGPIDVDLEA